MKTILVSLLIVLTLSGTLGVRAQGTAFTYQGRLNDGANPATGIYDLRFTLYDSGGGPTVVAGSLIYMPTRVTDGLFTVSLDFGAGVFTGAERWLEIGVRTNGGGAFSPLTPRQALTPTPHALYTPKAGLANFVAAGSITSASIANGAVTAAKLADNSVTADQLAAGAAAANLAASGQSGVASGGMVLSANANNGSLLNAGYLKLGKVDLTIDIDAWEQRASGTALAARYGHTAVWTDTEMIVWGGTDGGHFNDTFSYGPSRPLYLYKRP